MWDLPGGHVEPGEDEREALAREPGEEVGVVPRQVDPAPVLRIDDGELDLALWVVRSWHGEPRNLQPHEHDELRWVPAGEAGRLRLAYPTYADVVSRLVEAGEPVSPLPAPEPPLPG